MAATPHLKAFNQNGEYVASFKYEEDAAAFVAFLGKNASIRLGHSKAYTLWLEGSESQPANESYDFAARIMIERQTTRSTEKRAYPK